MTTPTTADVQRACTVLSSPALIRLITEIDDNGPIPPRALSRTLADVPTHHLRHATGQARALGFVQLQPGAGLGLTTFGAHLADLYDATARWARHHACPAPVSDFTSRIQHTLALLAQTSSTRVAESGPRPAGDPGPQPKVAADLDRPRDLLVQWLRSCPQITQSAAYEPAA
ncbi:hypothetical protein [Streptomyces leeuwenhoekii]|uniref:Uncharacterized protein n=1 Tax=Streptomyces leeuwenhoekii TaxID=1437453 RepID=A0A0F7VNU7_STRLW|nr:hypothetical protein [Streptomyces leeuwenhoekii]CQR61829.1 Hypothetical Protein SCAB [Streptomyces leeuwenhoekii]